VRDGCQIAVEEAAEGQLQRVLGPEDEGPNADVDRRERAETREGVEAVLGAGGKRTAAEHQQTKAKTSHQQGKCEEVRPANEVLSAGRPRGAVRFGRRRRGHSDAEGVDAGDDMAVAREGVPADGVGAGRQARQRRP
jgi:hypothetical protein